jgi:hypothetical protein
MHHAERATTGVSAAFRSAKAVTPTLQGLGVLEDWSGIKDSFKHTSLLLGNGASRAVWDPFGYASLYDKACGMSDRPLSTESRALFDFLDHTRNFEQVLGLLGASQQVVAGLSMVDQGEILACYENVRDALIESVHAVHLPWATSLASNLMAIKAEFSNYDRIFTTNYDLIPYWAIMSGDGPASFKDFFVDGGIFDGSLPAGNRIPVYYLHGALHLFKDSEKQTRKHLRTDFVNLLDLFKDSFSNGRTPLFVSEGTSADKMRSIRDSDYLSFAFDSLTSYRAPGPVVVFGHRLDPIFDDHLLQALHPNSPRRAAVSVYASSSEEIAACQLELKDRLPAWQLSFFDSASHPLGAADRRVTAASK